MVRAVTSTGDKTMRDVEKAFSALEDGDISAARSILLRLRKSAADEPAVLELGAAVSAMDGDLEGAMKSYKRWMAIDAENPRPRIDAAELLLYSGELEGVVELLDEGLELVEEEEDLVAAVLLKTEALLQLEQPDEAREALAELDSSALADATDLYRVGTLKLELDRPAEAEAIFRRLLALPDLAPEDVADARHGLGLIHEQREERDAMIREWLAVLDLDAKAEPAPWHVSAEEFQEIAEDAMAELPPEVLERLANVPILVEDLPSADIVREGNDPRLLGLFSGVPLPQKPAGGSPHLDVIHLYQRNLESAVVDPEDLAEQIRVTVLHETAHFFGLDDDDLEKMGLG
jgi:predicted Zn-dependent protease with MMP-like domain